MTECELACLVAAFSEIACAMHSESLFPLRFVEGFFFSYWNNKVKSIWLIIQTQGAVCAYWATIPHTVGYAPRSVLPKT